MTVKEKRAKNARTKELRLRVLKNLVTFKEDYTRHCRLHERKVKGLKKEVFVPNGNGGDGGSYSDDFLSFFQVEGVDLLWKEKRILIGDEMGVGKTAQAVAGKLEIENRSKRSCPTIVICPNFLKRQWNERIRAYCEKKRWGTIVQIDSYDNQTIKSVADADWLIINFESISFDDTACEKKLHQRAKLLRAILKARFQYVVVDEQHNAKNPSDDAYRSKHLKEIADAASYLCILDGTSIPNSLKDTYMLISLLEPEKYPTPKHVAIAHGNNPRIIRAILVCRRLQRRMDDIDPLPPLDDRIETVELTPEHREYYHAIMENYELEGSRKLLLLKQALLDPRLIPSQFLPPHLAMRVDTIVPSKYIALDRLVQNAMDGGEKIIIFSPLFQRRVTEVLEQRYARFGALRMDGTNSSEREEVRRKFKDDVNARILVVTDVGGEGISLISAQWEVFLDDPYAPGERKQMVARAHRRGQKKIVHVRSLVVPGTVDEGVVNLLRKKQEAIDFIERGEELSQEQKDVMGDNVARTNILRQHLYTPQQRVLRRASRMVGRSFDRIWSAMNRNEGRFGREYATDYPNGWEGSVHANAGEVYKRIIRAIEQREALPRKADLGSAFGVLRTVLGEPCFSLDCNIHHFIDSPMADRSAPNIVGGLHALPFSDSSLDLCVCSLALYCTTLEEREKAIREVYRVLRPSGWYVLAFPISRIAGCLETFAQALDRLGIEVLPEISGVLRSVEPEEVGFQIAVIVGRKKQAAPEDSIPQTLLELSAERNGGKGEATIRRHGTATRFTIDGEDLDVRLRRFVQRS